MSILQFLGIIWARRYIIVISTIVCGMIAAGVVQLIPPRWCFRRIGCRTSIRWRTGSMRSVSTPRCRSRIPHRRASDLP